MNESTAGTLNEDPGSLPADVRRERMLSLVRDREFLRVRELGEAFGVSEVTVRSDLDTLAARGQVVRIRGGAMARAAGLRERPFEETKSANAEEKAAIARAAAEHVASGETILLDVGTTTTAIARALVARDDLGDVTIFTNAINIALELEPAIPRFTVIVLGGTLRPLQHSLVDPLGALALNKIHATRVFLGCNGIDPIGGVTNVNLPEAEIKQRMLAGAHWRAVVADGSKLGRVELAHLCDIDEIDLLVTGASAADDVLARLEEGGLALEIAR